MSLSTSIYPSLYFVWETCNFELILFLHDFMTLRYLRFSQNRADKNFGNKPSHSITDRRFTSFLRDWRKEQIGRRSGRPLGTVYVKPFGSVSLSVSEASSLKPIDLRWRCKFNDNISYFRWVTKKFAILECSRTRKRAMLRSKPPATWLRQDWRQSNTGAVP